MTLLVDIAATDTKFELMWNLEQLKSIAHSKMNYLYRVCKQTN